MLCSKNVCKFIAGLFFKNFSLLLLAICTSVSLFASNEIDFSDLEKRYPLHFRGFDKTDHHTRENASFLDQLSTFNDKAHTKLEQLQQELLKKNDPKLKSCLDDIDNSLNSKKVNLFDYLSNLLTAVLSVSTKTDDEKIFFTSVGFSNPYKLIDYKDNGQRISLNFIKLTTNHTDRGDFEHRTYREFWSEENIFCQKFEKSTHDPIPHFIICTEPEEDILGLFYLAWTYNKGIHPIPVTLSADENKLHGIKMSPWGKVCHDLAHSEIDPGESSVEQFANNIGNYFLSLLNTQLSTLTSNEKKKYSIANVIPPIYDFSISVYEAYKTSLVQILEHSLKSLNTNQDNLSPQFEAFSASAFIQTHEVPVNLSESFATEDLQKLLKSSVKPIISYSNNHKDTTETDIFKTSFVTGETPLSDQEIFDIVKKRPLTEYTSNKNYSGLLTIEEEKIADFEIIRNKFFIQVNITMMDGYKYVYRSNTNYSITLNLEHDRQILLPASFILKNEYGYDIPEIPQNKDNNSDIENVKTYENDLQECRKNLDLGQDHLMDYFLKISKKLSEDTSLGGSSIADEFSKKYHQARDKLRQELPEFVGDIQEFLSSAMTFKK